jgi:hypothetical protein
MVKCVAKNYPLIFTCALATNTSGVSPMSQAWLIITSSAQQESLTNLFKI